MTHPVAEALKKVLADSYVLRLKTQNYHWNVTGPHFKPLHDLFQEQYEDLAAANDVIAELIRTLGVRVPATLSIFAKETSMTDGDEQADAKTMVKDLHASQEVMLKTLTTAIKAAQKAGDLVVEDYLIGRLAVHQKIVGCSRAACRNLFLSVLLPHHIGPISAIGQQ